MIERDCVRSSGAKTKVHAVGRGEIGFRLAGSRDRSLFFAFCFGPNSVDRVQSAEIECLRRSVAQPASNRR